MIIINVTEIGKELQDRKLGLTSAAGEALWRTEVYARHGISPMDPSL
jgi:hypothetical protein